MKNWIIVYSENGKSIFQALLRIEVGNERDKLYDTMPDARGSLNRLYVYYESF